MIINLLMIVTWIAFRIIWLDAVSTDWYGIMRLSLGYFVFIVNIYLLVYFFLMFLFFYNMLEQKTWKNRLIFVYTLLISICIFMSLIYFGIYIPTVRVVV